MKKRNLLSLSLVLLLVSCNDDISGTWKSYVVSISSIPTTINTHVTPFNTVMQINYFLNDKNKDEDNNMIYTAVSSIYETKVSKLHCVFDRHYNYKDEQGEIITNIKTINDSYGTGEAIKCSDELYDLLKQGVAAYELTDGMFNIFTGSLTDYWEEIFSRIYDYEELENVDPYFNEAQRERLEKLVDSIPSNLDEVKEQLTFDDENKTVTFNKTDFNNGIRTIISVGGNAKGYATDLIKESLVDMGFKEGYLISGGSSISSLGEPIYTKDSGGQKISVINPAKSTFFQKESAFSFKVTEEFNFSTSGNYTDNKSYAFVDNDGKRVYRHHIINPFTGYPESYYRSVSILTHSLSNIMVDSLSTAFMNLDLEQGLVLRNKVLETYPNVDLELLYLVQQNNDENAVSTVYATSDIDGTLQPAEGINIIYEN